MHCNCDRGLRSEGLLFENETVILAKVAVLMLCWGFISDILLWWNTDKQIYTARNPRGPSQKIIQQIILKQKMSGIPKAISSLIFEFVLFLLH